MEMESLPELPNDITCYHILPRLPAKSLMRFRCVCKSWSSLIRSPSFINTHGNFNSKKHTSLLLTAWDAATRQQHFFSLQINQEETPPPSTRHLLNLPSLQSVRPILYDAQAVNGLLCLYPSDNLEPNRCITITNPSISSILALESIILPHSAPAPHSILVAYHFGFSPLTNEFHVVQVKMSSYEDLVEDSYARAVEIFKIFKLGTGLWRGIEIDLSDLPLYHGCQFDKRSVCVHGGWSHTLGACDG